MEELTKEQKESAKKIKSLMDKLLRKNYMDPNIMNQIGEAYLEFGREFLPDELKKSPVFKRGYLDDIKNFSREIFKEEKSKEEDKSLEYWEKELEKMDKKKKEDNK